MLPSPTYISNFVEQQFPAFYREEGPAFIAFVKAYYEWLEETNNSIYKSRNLFSTQDIDLTATAFIENFRYKYLNGIPKEVAGDKRFLLKHILDLYRSKGSKEGLSLLFRLLYNEEISIYLPAVDILKPSDGRWIEKKYFEVTNLDTNYKFQGKFITGSASGATAFIDSYEKIYIQDKIVHVFFLTNIFGTFQVGEKIYYDLDLINEAPFILGSPTGIDIYYGDPFQANGDVLTSNVVSGRIGLKGVIANTYTVSTGFIDFRIINGGSGYTTNPTINVSTGSNTSGSGAIFTSVSLSNVSTFTYSTTKISYAPYNGVAQSFNANTSVNSTADFIAFANCQFANGDTATYLVAAGNTALSGLSNNTLYWIVDANSSGVKLASSYGGSAINITAGSTQNGHSLTGGNTALKGLNIASYGSSMNNANSSTTLQNALGYQNTTVGTIQLLVGVNQGNNYNGNVSVTVTETLVSGYNLPDGSGGIQGNNAVIIGPVIQGNGTPTSIRIVDSGLGFNIEEEGVIFTNSANTSKTITGNVVLGAIGTSEGFWQDTYGKLDENKYISDNDYYQENSYEINFSQSLDKYINILKEVMHPVGNKIFGKALLAHIESEGITVQESSVNQT
jgi:hypothetical protein